MRKLRVEAYIGSAACREQIRTRKAARSPARLQNPAAFATASPKPRSSKMNVINDLPVLSTISSYEMLELEFSSELRAIVEAIGFPRNMQYQGVRIELVCRHSRLKRPPMTRPIRHVTDAASSVNDGSVAAPLLSCLPSPRGAL